MKNLFCLIFSFLSFLNLNAQKVILSLEQFGAKSDAVILTDGSISTGSTVLKSQRNSFTQSDIGKIIFIAGAEKNGNTLIGTITKIVSDNSVAVSTPAILTVSNANITYGTDCTDAFIQFNKTARAGKDVVLNMKPGTYLTKFNNYLAGIRNITLNGNGCKIICTHGAYEPYNSARANVGLFMPSCFDNVDNNYYENSQLSQVSFGYRIQTSTAGTRAVKTMSVADASNFKPGNWILVYGLHHEDFGGWPPDPRFFEYAKVTDIDRSSGTVYLNRALKNSYDSGWPDGKTRTGVGAARIINLDRDNFTIVENLVMRNVNFTPFNGWNGKFADNIRNSRFELYGFIYGDISNITAAGAYFGQGEKLLVDHITLTNACEPDKVLDSCIIKNSRIARFVGAGGLNYLDLVNNTFTDGFNASPRNLYITGNTFKTVGTTSQSLAAFGFNKGTDYIQIGTNTWDCSGGSRSSLISPPSSVTMTVGAIVNNTTITIPFNSFLTAHNSRKVEPGAKGYTTSGKEFEITRVYQYDTDNIAVSGVFTHGGPTSGDNYVFQFAPRIDETGKQIKIGENANNYNLFQGVGSTTKLNSKEK